MSDKVLFVDDDPNVLNAFRRQFRGKYDVTTATGGHAALSVLAEEGPFAVVVTDMKMPEIDGLELLKRSKKIASDSITIMLTGNADQQTAVDAVNEGKVYRFLNKPCSSEELGKELELGLEEYRLRAAEKRLLKGTLNGAIKLLMDLLSAAAPEFYSCDLDLRKDAAKISLELGLENEWEIEVATMLSRIGYFTLPPETMARVRADEELNVTERQIVEHLPEVAHSLLAHIPRLKNVARIVLYQSKNYDGTGFPEDDLSGDGIPIESRILRGLRDYSQLVGKGDLAHEDALEQLSAETGFYDPQVLSAIRALPNDSAGERLHPPIKIGVAGLRAGQVLVSNIETEDGKLLCTAGQELSEAIVGRLLNYHKLHNVNEPIAVAAK